MKILKEEKGYDLPDHYLDYFDISSKCELHYTYQVDETLKGGGEFHLYPVSDALSFTKDPELYHKDADDEDKAILRHFRIIDDHPFSGDYKLSAFFKKPGYAPPSVPDIYFFDRG
jgi:hypothetical protein